MISKNQPQASPESLESFVAPGDAGNVLTSDGDKWESAPAGGSGSFSGCRVYNSSSQTINNNSQTVLVFDTDLYDTDNYHNTSSNTGRLTAPTDGYYLITFTGRWGSDVGGINQHHIRKNGSDYLMTITGSLGSTTIPPIITVAYLLANDYVEFLSRHVTGSANSINSNYQYEPVATMTKLG